jgi:hypothetical protein
VRDVVTLEEYGVKISSIDVAYNDEGAIQEGEEILVIIRRIAWNEIEISFGSITKEDEIEWRKPLFEPLPLCIFNQEERTEEESVEVREVEEEISIVREGEDKSGGEVEVSERSLVPVVGSNSQSRRPCSRSNMANQDSTLKLVAFYVMGRDDAKQHWFTCEAIWSIKIVTNKASK